MPVNSFENYPMSWKPRKEELKRPYYISIANRLEQDIVSGNLPENTKLPPQRELADFLDLNLSTITKAYKMCELKGLLYAVTGKGTFVSPGIDAQDTFLERNSSVIELGIIKPFYEYNQQVLSAARLVTARPGAEKLLEYGDPLGTKRQRRAASGWLRHLGIEAAWENILVTAGAQNALSIILISLFQTGDNIAVDHFTYTNFKGLANFLRIRLIAVDTDDCGMSPSSLLQLCKNTEVKAVYLMPSCSNPTGIIMPSLRRQEIAGIAREFQLLIIEDDIYSFLAPGEEKPFFSIAPEQTFHICSTSKSICAGLRVAFFAFPPQYRQTLISGLLNMNLKTVSLNAEIIAELINSGEAAKIAEQKLTLARKRNQIFQSIFPGTSPDGGRQACFFRWLPLPGHLTSEEAEILALQNGIHILGSHRFAMRSEQKSSFVRVSLASPGTEEELRTGLLILKRITEESPADFFV
ncbi:MAG: PLP-dependent aminotransferase family protein [Lachnospiraceae bacterium]|nr:PLP-dependent aminotransferase family protein [Lachnospiraceae bacterium]